MKSSLLVLCLSGVALGTGCATSSHDVQKSALGVARSADAVLAHLDEPGPVELETVTSCDWSVERGGLINLDHPTAKAAHLEDGDEPIQVFFHALRHPTRGLFIVDTGVETALRDAPDRSAMRGMVANAMHMGKMKVYAPLGEWLAGQSQPLAGVFLTHLHPDHIAGMADVPAGTPVFTGPGEASKRAFVNLVVQGATDRALEGKPALSEWSFNADPQGLFEGAVDVFGDGSVWALWVPGHTPGSTAYLVRSTKGPVLLLGDASHTRWGWEHDVEPGSFTQDGPRGVESFKKLRAFVAAHPGVEVRFGHQH
ncbi:MULTISPECIES: MBL fold metallo-hydrolase [Corallococcus]|uniref:MBL fold metallo-hydrolase n=1 Tax=Corallococcus TaxID=83461 RepID=UPI00117C953C|nr:MULTISPECIES: MBL fold metallo-hydrolase [Corallococcus]NBD13880.1 MBL fold metallo-hydrolase [Corallococcus silvisoli]TSC24461.1 MBL fold metallo-hydrolase [Corallococcus sp. Z5C101001]